MIFPEVRECRTVDSRIALQVTNHWIHFRSTYDDMFDKLISSDRPSDLLSARELRDLAFLFEKELVVVRSPAFLIHRYVNLLTKVLSVCGKLRSREWLKSGDHLREVGGDLDSLSAAVIRQCRWILQTEHIPSSETPTDDNILERTLIHARKHIPIQLNSVEDSSVVQHKETGTGQHKETGTPLRKKGSPVLKSAPAHQPIGLSAHQSIGLPASMLSVSKRDDDTESVASGVSVKVSISRKSPIHSMRNELK
eukprot:275175_1